MDVFTVHEGGGTLSSGGGGGTSVAHGHGIHSTSAAEAPAAPAPGEIEGMGVMGGGGGGPGGSAAPLGGGGASAPRPATGPGVLSGMANLAAATARQYMDPNVIDPFKLMKPQLKDLTESIKLLTHVDNPLLQK